MGKSQHYQLIEKWANNPPVYKAPPLYEPTKTNHRRHRIALGILIGTIARDIRHGGQLR